MSPFNPDNKRFRFKIAAGIFVAVIVAVFLGGAIVMYLWNAILPSVLHVESLTYWQAVGLLILCKILFGNFNRGGRGDRRSFGTKSTEWKEKWLNMTEDEKAQFKEQWRKRCWDVIHYLSSREEKLSNFSDYCILLWLEKAIGIVYLWVSIIKISKTNGSQRYKESWERQ